MVAKIIGFLIAFGLIIKLFEVLAAYREFIYLGIIVIMGIIIIVGQIKKTKIKTINEEAEEQKRLNDIEAEVQKRLNDIETEKQQKLKDIKIEENKFDIMAKQYKQDIDMLRKEKNELKDSIAFLSKEYNEKASDFYSEIYRNFENISSEEIKNQLNLIVMEEKVMIKAKKAVIFKDNDVISREMTNNISQLLRCFNAETDIIINSVKISNLDTMRNKLLSAFEKNNKLFETDNISLSAEFFDLKQKELVCVYNYLKKVEEEKETQKAIKAQMAEDAKVLREIEREKIKIEKEEKQFKSEINKMMQYLQQASDVEKQLYIDKIKELEEKLKLVEKDKENVFQREQNTRAGYVYVISNIGSFGEDVYKIGMTRRLEPLERVKELGDASVPFEFDVHAMIFSEDAPALETILHQTFRDREVNKINHRKEFFKVSLAEIEKVVKENYNTTVTFVHVPPAEEYRASLLAETETVSVSA